MQLLKQSTAATVLVGPVLDSAGLPITTAVIGDFQITKNGSSAALASPATATHSHNGNYLIALSTGNTDTAGRLVITVNNSAQAMGSHRFTVLVASVFDAIVTNATNTTGGLPTATGTITALAGAVSTFAGGAVASVTNPVTVGTNNDKTGYTAAVSDKTGFSLLAGTGLGAQNGSVALVTKVDELGANALTANGAVDAIPTAVWNALTTTAWVSDSFGKHILISNNNNRSVQVTGAGSGHIAADIHALQAGVITSAAFSSNWLTAAGLASDAATEIATAVAGIQVLSWLDSMIEDDGTGQKRFDSVAVSLAGGGGGGGTDWTANERTAIRAILGVPTSGTTPTDPSSGILDEIRDKTALITAGGTVNVSTPVTATGQLASPLIIGDDYLAANGRRFRWTVELPTGYVIATSTARFGMRYEDEQGVNSFIKTGTVSDAGSGNVYLDFDLTKEVETGLLRPGWYEWSVEIVSGSGVEITRVKSGKNVEWQEKQT